MCFKRHVPGEPPPPWAAQPGRQDRLDGPNRVSVPSLGTPVAPVWLEGWLSSLSPALPTSRGPQAGLLSHMGMLAPWSAASTGDGDSWMEPPGPVSCQARAQLSKIMSAQPTCISSCFALREKRFLQAQLYGSDRQGRMGTAQTSTTLVPDIVPDISSIN